MDEANEVPWKAPQFVMIPEAEYRQMKAAIVTVNGLNLHANMAGLGRRLAALEAEHGSPDKMRSIEAALALMHREMRAIEKRSSTALRTAGVVRDQLMLDSGEVEPPWLDDGEDEGTFADWLMAQLAKIDARFSALEKTARPAVALRRLNDVDARFEKVEARLNGLEEDMVKHGDRLNAIQWGGAKPKPHQIGYGTEMDRISAARRDALDGAVTRVKADMAGHFSDATIARVLEAIRPGASQSRGNDRLASEGL